MVTIVKEPADRRRKRIGLWYVVGMMNSQFTIVGIGEALFDLFPDRQILGGAPLNVAVHAHQLARLRDGRGVIASRVGQDALGRQIHQALQERGMDTTYLQDDPDRATGKVYVDVDEAGQPTFDIVTDVAWDVIQYDGDLEYLARSCQAVCFGSLAQRNAESRATIHRVLNEARRAVRLFDVNLRPPHYEPYIIQRSCEAATAVKLNEAELPQVTRMVGIFPPAGVAEEALQDALARALRKKFDLKQVILTRGERGTVIYTASDRHEAETVAVAEASRLAGEAEAASDAVGAGDACAAGVLVGLALRLPILQTIRLANLAGAYVAAQPGATPVFPDKLLEQARALMGQHGG